MGPVHEEVGGSGTASQVYAESQSLLWHLFAPTQGRALGEFMGMVEEEMSTWQSLSNCPRFQWHHKNLAVDPAHVAREMLGQVLLLDAHASSLFFMAPGAPAHTPSASSTACLWQASCTKCRRRHCRSLAPPLTPAPTRNCAEG